MFSVCVGDVLLCGGLDVWRHCCVSVLLCFALLCVCVCVCYILGCWAYRVSGLWFDSVVGGVGINSRP